ncbi:hypothetical protein Y1Q_0005328 [Alligator mississippiensis]|uniref:Cyclic nucleotide-binding domain-containing protein n=1 Tax=Alligator mississippiensis TaxID=8496 RepID=A0A151MVL1_ALLMI|nr:hypothetical protein Y1Q_0005328 [Alligator mississippiensis]
MKKSTSARRNKSLKIFLLKAAIPSSLMNKSKPGDDRVDTSKECTDKEAGGTESAKQETSCPQFIVLQASKCEDIVLPGNETHGSYKSLRKFRRAVLVIQVIRNLIKMYRKKLAFKIESQNADTSAANRDYAASKAELLSFAQLQYTGSSTETENLLFDCAYFKAKVETTISSEARVILSGPPENRTSEGIKLAMLSLKSTVSTFSEYPVHIQEKLAQLGWYECFGPGRVIIRQGHVPQNFYLILSGTAVVTKVALNQQTGELYARTVAFLKKGKYFGDVAILTGARRNATVVCHDTVSLLALSRQDFLNIFLSRESTEGPDFIDFLHKTELLSGWPIEKLPYNNPRICAQTFFRPGTVITKDSKSSSKIYVIKTGRLRVLKAVTPLKPRLSLKSFRYSRLYYEPASNEGYSNEALTKQREPGSQKVQLFSDTFIEEEYLLPVLQREKKTPEQQSTASCTQKALTSDMEDSTEMKERADATKKFIHIQTLRAGDIFGLVYVVFEDALSMTLVSDGAECIVVSKEFFKKHMNEDYRQKLCTSVQPYPSKEMLQRKMQDYINWKAYKSLLINGPH